MLASWVGVPAEEVAFTCAGINHQSFFLDFRHGREDLYPRIRQAAEREENLGREPVRIELMRHFGYFVTESSGHASEYVPYFRKSAPAVEQDLAPRFTDEETSWYDYGRTGGYLRHCLARREEDLDGPAPEARTHEYGSSIIEAMETGVPTAINGNVPNQRLIENLPDGCCVEVPCLVDASGVRPTVVGRLPAQLGALNRTNVNVQELVVEAALSGSTDAVRQAVALDPLTAAVCTLPEVERMTEEMLAAQERWLPQF
jgi:alpha-galactosidase